jgi:hypothetical protein
METKMPHPGHDKHLCYLNNLDFQKTNPQEYKALIQNGKYFCQNCGRVAAEQKNLCKPVQM